MLLLFLYLIAFPFGQLLSFQVSPSARIHTVDILALVTVFIWLVDLLWRFFSKEKPKVWPIFTRPLLSFASFASFTYLLGLATNGTNDFLPGAAYLARLIVYSLFTLSVWDIVQRQGKKAKQVLFDCLIVVGFFIGLGGLLGYMFFPDTRALAEYGWDNHYFRLIGSLLDPTFTGIILVLFLVLVICREWRGLNEKVLSVVLFATGWVALFLTYSRGSFVGLAAALSCVFLIKRNWKFFSFTLLLFLTTLFILPHPMQSAGTNLARTQTIVSRVQSYDEGLITWFKSPTFGVGYNLYKSQENASQGKITHSASGVHSSLIFILATTGVAGLLIYLGFWRQVVRLGWEQRFKTKGLALICSVAALFAHSLFDNSLVYPWVVGWMAILLAVQ